MWKQHCCCQCFSTYRGNQIRNENHPGIKAIMLCHTYFGWGGQKWLWTLRWSIFIPSKTTDPPGPVLSALIGSDSPASQVSVYHIAHYLVLLTILNLGRSASTRDLLLVNHSHTLEQPSAANVTKCHCWVTIYLYNAIKYHNIPEVSVSRWKSFLSAIFKQILNQIKITLTCWKPCTWNFCNVLKMSVFFKKMAFLIPCFSLVP